MFSTEVATNYYDSHMTGLPENLQCGFMKRRVEINTCNISQC